jgi:hypothetical protein
VSCSICGSDCTGVPDIKHSVSYPFLPGGVDLMADEDYVIAPHRIVDDELERVVYGPGDRVPWDEAVKYGLVPKPRKTPAKKTVAKKVPARARKPTEDRARKPGSNR